MYSRKEAFDMFEKINEPLEVKIERLSITRDFIEKGVYCDAISKELNIPIMEGRIYYSLIMHVKADRESK